MNNFSNKMKSELLSTIKQMEENKKCFVKNSSKDFIRNRKLSFFNVLKLLLCLEGKNSFITMAEYFNYSEKMPSQSALIQQRKKLNEIAMPYLFHKFTSSYNALKNIKGYRLLAVDGSKLNIHHNPNDKDTHVKTVPGYKGHNKLHINCMYDLCNKIFVDTCIQAVRKCNESRALIDMVKRFDSNEKAIIIADRGYESYNVFANIQEKGFKYLIRVKDITSTGISSTFKFPEADEFDATKRVNITKRMGRIPLDKRHEYKKLCKVNPFDFIKEGSYETYSMDIRFVRFKISDSSYETIVTNLDEREFDSTEIKELYQLRWKIENSFRELKYLTGLNSLNSKKVELITQEIYAKLTMYNFYSIISTNVKIKDKNRKYSYTINFSKAITVCKKFFKCPANERPPNVEILIQRYISPVRNGRKYPRNITTKSWVNFMYRIS
ncbi:IS4 family transposase [Clostridium sp. BJN0001]|uniref:IS4 family transposase n=1 Tax=Clostridium sp. BJN0001 TaxID=2930219 RepID=UPI001FD283EA|nr:IS4 family transposase [Clostridium sp. BJN0001]